MKKIFQSFLLAISLLVAMSMSGCIFPPPHGSQGQQKGRTMQGPQKSPHPVVKPITSTFKWAGNKDGILSFTMTDGEVCKGEYRIASWSETSSFFNKSDYREYYGEVGPANGTKYIQATVYGDKGLIIQAEYFPTGHSLNDGYGLAKDNQGNIYGI